MGKESASNKGDTGDAGSIPGLGQTPEVGNGNPLHYSCQKNPMDRGVWRATVHGLTKSWTWLSTWHMAWHINSPALIIFWRRKWQPTPVLLPRKPHGQRTLVQATVYGVTESDTTERLHFTYYIWKKYFGLKIERPDSNSKIVFLFYIFW